MAAIDLFVLQGFITATRQALETMAFLEVEVVGVQPIAEAPSSFEVMASMRLSGESPGMVGLGFDEKTGTAIVASMIEASPEEVSRDDMLDGASELANLVAGGARAQLEGNETNFELSLPEVAQGVPNPFPGSDADSAFVLFRAAGGEVGLLLRMGEPS